MTSRDEYLTDALRALVAFVGMKAVKRALLDLEEEGGKSAPVDQSEKRPKPAPGVPRLIADLAPVDAPRHEAIVAFWLKLRAGHVLPEAEDVRRFAEAAGSKSLSGRSRRDLVAKLAPLLVALPPEGLFTLLKRAEQITGEERSQGYSVLTDHLLRGTQRSKSVS